MIVTVVANNGHTFTTRRLSHKCSLTDNNDPAKEMFIAHLMPFDDFYSEFIEVLEK